MRDDPNDKEEEEEDENEVGDDEVEYIESEPAGELPPLSAQHLSYYTLTLHWDLTCVHTLTLQSNSHTHTLLLLSYHHSHTVSHCIGISQSLH